MYVPLDVTLHMKRQCLFGTAISLLVLIVLISGCTSGPAGEPAATGAPSIDMPMGTATPAATGVPAVSPGPAAGEGISTASLFDHAKFTWYQYKITAGAMGMPMTHTYKYDDVTYQGQQARHANITMDMLPDALVYLDIWTDILDGGTLNVHEIAFSNGIMTKNADIDTANYTKWEGTDLASPQFTAALLQPTDTEAVTVGDRTYMATKYAGTAGDQQYTYWASQDLPVPVKFAVHDAKGDTTYELTGWG